VSDRFADLVGQVDVAFVVDTTGSMGPFIEAARRHIRRLVEEIGEKGDLDLQFAVVEYRDHPQQEASFVTRPHPFGDGVSLQAALELLQPSGGGDGPEAVLDGLVAAANLQWRHEADRLCYLVGDAPPHGYAAGGDSWPHGCPCRATPNGVVELLRGRGIQLHAIALHSEPDLVRAFGELSEGCGGTLTETHDDPEQAVAAAAPPLTMAMRTIESARDYLTVADRVGSMDPEAIAPAMGVPKKTAEGIAAYLRRRGLFKRGE
jgi:hypothetical protein